MRTSTVRLVSDPEELRAFARPFGGQYLVTGKGCFSATITKANLENVWAQCLGESSARSWRYAYTQPRISIFFQAVPGCAMAYGGRELGGEDIGISVPGLDLWQRVDGRSQLAGFSLPQDVVARNARNLFGRDLTPRSDRFVGTLPPLLMARLRRSHAELMKLANTSPEIIMNPGIAQALDVQMTEVFLECLESGCPEGAHPGRRKQSSLVSRLYELGVERADKPLYVTDACAALGVSARVLHRACREQLGIGPKKYLMIRRFHMARRALLSASPEASVTDVAMRFGFFELGRFAVEYKAIFGESPSATLRDERDPDHVNARRGLIARSGEAYAY